MSSSESEHLFVYGTLRAGCTTSVARRLAKLAVRRGAATVEGRLFDLGRYPGLVLGGAVGGVVGDAVPGDVYDLGADAPAMLAALDDYEGCGPADPPPHAFTRVRARALFASGESLAVWLYEYRGDVSRARRIARWP